MLLDLSTMHRIDLSTPRPATRSEPPVIVRAMYEGALVRVWMSDDTNSHCANDDTTPLGRQLQEWQLVDGNVIEDYSPPPITPYEVDIERDRRNHLGEEIHLKSGKVVYIPTATGEDYDNINYASDTALTLIAKTEPGMRGAISELADAITPNVPTAGIMTIRDFYRRPLEVTYHEMAEISVWVTNNVNVVNQAAHLLKDMDPIPRDYTDDKYWPTGILRPPAEPPTT